MKKYGKHRACKLNPDPTEGKNPGTLAYWEADYTSREDTTKASSSTQPTRASKRVHKDRIGGNTGHFISPFAVFSDYYISLPIG